MYVIESVCKKYVKPRRVTSSTDVNEQESMVSAVHKLCIFTKSEESPYQHYKSHKKSLLVLQLTYPTATQESCVIIL